ncbi:MAG TPA: hypothetical protein VNR67_00185 [Solirubrobacterales bacterium]|nr:hypothetical protein [Solirubrobacterales bacterium]
MLALLAIACFPGAAQAVEATGPQYESDIPTVPQEESSPPKKKGGSNDGGTENEEAGKSNVPTGQGSGGNGPSSGGGANNGQTSQGSDGGAGKGGDGAKTAAGGVGDGKPLATTYAPASSESDDGSSPLVPILIAIAVLAAISIGAFLYRQRRQDDPGSPVSPPKAS